MPAPRATKAVPAPTTAAPARTTRARGAAKAVPVDESGLAGALERVLKVSEPAPQQKRRTVVASTARAGPSKAGEPDTKPVVGKRAPTLTTTAAKASTGVESTKPARSVRPTPRRADSPVKLSRETRPVAGPSRKMPSSATSSTRAQAGSSAPSTISGTTKSTTTTTTSSTTRTSTIQSTTSRLHPAARVPASSKGTSTSAISAKGKEKALPPPRPSFPWSDPDSDLPSSKRAVQAMAALNESIRSISSAIQAGFRHQTPTGEWTASRVEELVATAELALQVLWQLDEAGKVGSKGIELDKGAQSLALKLVLMNMHDGALRLQSLSRPRLLLLYEHVNDDPDGSQDLPAAEEDEDLGDPTRLLLLQASLCSWTAAVGLKRFPDFKRIIRADKTAHLDRLQLARAMASREALRPHIHLFYRALSSATLDTSQVLAARQLTFCFLALIVTSSKEQGSSQPPQFWDALRKQLATDISSAGSSNDDFLPAALRCIASLVDWVDESVGDGTTREAWFCNTEWSNLAEFWVDLARQIKDDGMIAMALMHLKERHLRSGRTDQPDIVLDLPNPMGPDKALAELTVMKAAFSQLQVLAEQLSEGETDKIDNFVTSLSDVDLERFPQYLAVLAVEESAADVIAKALRAFERLRRPMSRCMSTAFSQAHADSSSTLRGWLMKAATAVETILEACPTIPSNLRSDMVSGVIGSVMAVNKVDQGGTVSSTDILSSLVQARSIMSRVEDHTSVADKIDWLRCLSAAAFNSATIYWRGNNAASCVELGKVSCKWAQELLDLSQDLTPEESGKVGLEVLQQAGDQLPRRWELVCACHHKLSDQPAALDACFQILRTQPARIFESLSRSANSDPIEKSFALIPALSGVMQRLVSLLLWDPDTARPVLTAFLEDWRSKAYSVLCIGAVCEKLFMSMEAEAHSAEVARLLLDIGRLALSTYDPQMCPLRRARVATRVAAVALASGLETDTIEPLLQEVNRLSATRDWAEDSQLAKYRHEIVGVAHVMRALQAYHSPANPASLVEEAARTALNSIRQLVIPPSDPASPLKPQAPPARQPLGKATTVRGPPKPGARPMTARAVSETVKKVSPAGPRLMSKPAKTPASPKREAQAPVPVFEDHSRLSTLLEALASLLGLLGLVFLKIDTLRALRLIERHSSDQSEDYIRHSAQLAAEYSKLGKHSRARSVLAQALNVATDKPGTSPYVLVQLHLRRCMSSTAAGDRDQAVSSFVEAERVAKLISNAPSTSRRKDVINRSESIERAALARQALAAISLADDDASTAIMLTATVMRLRMRAADVICRIAPIIATPQTAKEDVFTAPPPAKTGADEPAKDDNPSQSARSPPFSGKHLNGVQWQIAQAYLDTALDLTDLLASRGSVKDSEYYLRQADQVATSVKSSVYVARTAARLADLRYRMRRLEESSNKLGEASTALSSSRGPDSVDVERIRGDLLSRQDLADEASGAFDLALEGIHGLSEEFATIEKIIASPERPSLKLSTSVSRLSTSMSALRLSASSSEPLLPATLGLVLRHQAWMKHATDPSAVQSALLRLQALSGEESKSDQLLFEGKLALSEAFNQFKTDLFMSSLTESTIALPMGASGRKVQDRLSSRQNIQVVLHRAQTSFHSALEIAYRSGKVEDIRHALLSLTLLCTFQTSLGMGSSVITANAASILAATPSITLSREMIEAIDFKFLNPDVDDLLWPESNSPQKPIDDADEEEKILREYWDSARGRYASTAFGSANYDLSMLPADWAVVSINVTDDKNTMFISRHQNGHEPLVFCLPLDRHGRREGDDDIFTFEAAQAELADIISSSDRTARSAKDVADTQAAKAAWWDEREQLNKRLRTLLETIEFCWLGAFKTILSPRYGVESRKLDHFRTKLDRIFSQALSSQGAALKKQKVTLDDALLECFVTLSSRSKDEEIEDLVYFILDIYQFHGVPVALAELDMDQLSLDVKSLLQDLEVSYHPAKQPKQPEHLFLALDKNVSPFPWESIPILRSRPISRIPSLPFLLDQLALGQTLRPTDAVGRRKVNSKKTYYVLNPSGDLKKTQAFFEPWLDGMIKKSSWQGVKGRPPTELEYSSALRDSELVLYFGHGGAEMYIRSHKIAHLPKCASVMLWGCSSGELQDAGDLDRWGNPWNYIKAGCPSLVANLWDVTDREIDRLSDSVFKRLHLDPAHVPDGGGPGLLPLAEVSNVQAVNLARDDCRLKYLTGAAPVVYGIPVWLH